MTADYCFDDDKIQYVVVFGGGGTDADDKKNWVDSANVLLFYRSYQSLLLLELNKPVEGAKMAPLMRGDIFGTHKEGVILVCGRTKYDRLSAEGHSGHNGKTLYTALVNIGNNPKNE